MKVFARVDQQSPSLLDKVGVPPTLNLKIVPKLLDKNQTRKTSKAASRSAQDCIKMGPDRKADLVVLWKPRMS